MRMAAYATARANAARSETPDIADAAAHGDGFAAWLADCRRWRGSNDHVPDRRGRAAAAVAGDHHRRDVGQRSLGLTTGSGIPRRPRRYFSWIVYAAYMHLHTRPPGAARAPRG